MAQGRGSARFAMGVAILCLVLLTEPALGAIYNVGGAAGWTFNVNSWPRGKSFRAGDVLVFKYGRAIHNVVAVDKSGYDTCTSSRGSRVYQTGNDRLSLAKGQHFFICTFPGHCQAGMKIAVNAA